MLILLQHSGRRVVKHGGLWRTPTTTAAAGLLVMILRQKSGRPIAKHVGLSELQNFCAWCLHDNFEAGYGWGLKSVSLQYTWYIL